LRPHQSQPKLGELLERAGAVDEGQSSPIALPTKLSDRSASVIKPPAPSGIAKRMQCPATAEGVLALLGFAGARRGFANRRQHLSR